MVVVGVHQELVKKKETTGTPQFSTLLHQLVVVAVVDFLLLMTALTVAQAVAVVTLERELEMAGWHHHLAKEATVATETGMGRLVTRLVAVVEAQQAQAQMQHQPLEEMVALEPHLILLELLSPVLVAVVVAQMTALLVSRLEREALEAVVTQTNQEITETRTRAAVAVVTTQLTQGQEEQAVQAWSSSNIHLHSPSPTPVVVSHIRQQQQVGLLLQPLLPEPAMSLGVNDGTLRIFR
jgi:hypothetical protein